MSGVRTAIRVCPACGTPAGAHDVCRCGTDLSALPELPTLDEWQARNTKPMPQLAPLLHPTEESRLALAVVAAGVTVVILLIVVAAAGSAGALAGLLLFVGIVLGTTWVALQLFRAKLLGRSVRVAADSMPELQELIDDVRETLQYHRRVDFYVTAKAELPVTTASYLGTRVVILEGPLVADLMKPGKRAQMTFLVGRSIGALRAKHMRMDLVVTLLDALNVLRFPSPFFLPWYRSITYSGDQIGMVCCGDLEAALEATRRVIVGGELAGQLQDGDVVPQAAAVQQDALPRLSQLLMAEPHPTNRYANLLCFGRYHDPELWSRVNRSLDPAAAGHLERMWARSPYRARAA